MKLSGWTDAAAGAARRFKLVQGQTTRVCVLDLSPEMMRVHYLKGAGYYLCLGDGCPFCATGSEWKVRYASYIFVYNQDMYGQLTQGEGGGVEGAITPWAYSQDKMTQLMQIAKMYEGTGPLTSFDLVFICIEEGFQKYQIMPDPSGAPMWMRDAALKAKVDAEYAKLPKDLSAKCGKRVSISEAQMVVTQTGAPSTGAAGLPQSGAEGFGQMPRAPQQGAMPMPQPGLQPAPGIMGAMPAASPGALPGPAQAVPQVAPVPAPAPVPVPAVPPVQSPPVQMPAPALPATTPEEARARIDSLINLPAPPTA